MLIVATAPARSAFQQWTPLARHPAHPCHVPCGLDASVATDRHGILRLEYRLTADLAQFLIPERAGAVRRDGLWKHSCFEAFIRCAGATDYLELNFSPSGDWAAYRFLAYRKPATGVVELPSPEIIVRRHLSGLELSAVIRLEGVLPPCREMGVGLSAVIEAKEGSLSYWALKHPSEKPDFHHPDSFALSLAMDAPAQT